MDDYCYFEVKMTNPQNSPYNRPYKTKRLHKFSIIAIIAWAMVIVLFLLHTFVFINHLIIALMMSVCLFVAICIGLLAL